jgi:hypothetical protein
LRAFTDNLAKLTGTGDEGERAIPLAWIFHLVGDVHQPLHCTSLVTTTYPRGDKGGNLFYIRVREGSRPIPLHQLWDGLIMGTSRFQTVRNVAIKLRNRPEFAPDNLTELAEGRFDRWAQESFALAREVVYRTGTLPGSVNALAAPVLPEGYTRQAKAVAERRIVLAGYRLADGLRKLIATSQ